ncbi:phosphotyrosine protein phosphatase [Xanthomonas sp. WHRI 10064A]|uniref:low molecular weight protein tyrosine phosphatase family protein n=1 Tax=unclassified Xanthomonas TaxID=2643310 RepID=UPI002B232FD6|nr:MULTISPECIES: phosphotyrosine protein phosphatase [unclassified Xanthomonas]MEA9589354.1 phosphotyrosine protein phosphatase [Xanthomonas sp. WHRI 10064B]MEA9616723.1 phosphotyrosine protein phosphatase [Xanthomonas sp. WHRI 10064A]
MLFVCSRNRLRSPTAERVFADWPGVQTQSAGLAADAQVQVTPELLQESDLVLVMERRHLQLLRKRFAAHLLHCRVVSLQIPDDYTYMDPALIRRLEHTVPPLLRLPAYS